MLFLGSLYNIIARSCATKVNHFALIKLSFLAVDKSIFYFLLFAFFRLLWLLFVKKRRSLRSELVVWIFAFYLILLLMVTTFRSSYFPWQIVWHWQRPLTDINLVFLKETWKLLYAPSELDFIYNFLGNILCFIPFGFLLPFLPNQHVSFGKTLLLGMLLSFMIESLQFFLATGVSDIDDFFFNSCGVCIGYGLSCLWYRFV